MDAWMNRFGSFAEGVLIMVCPVLLAMALKKVDLKSEEHGRAVPIVMLVVAAVTLITGICPFLIRCVSKSNRFSNGRRRPPHTVIRLLAPISSTFLVVLACLIIRLIIFDNWAYPVIGALIGLCFVIRTIMYCYGTDRQEDAATADKEYCRNLENSLEFVAGITALLFLGLEGLALEGQINSSKGIQDRLASPMGTSFIVCVVCVGLMLVATIPPRDIIKVNLTVIFDVLTAFAVSSVMFFIMYSLMKLQALLLMASPFLILMVYAFHVAVPMERVGSNTDDNNRGPETEITISGEGESDSDEECNKPASLELTKVTFTGFLAVSIPSISNGSLNMCTHWFILLSGAAIVSGLVWRLLTHIRSDDFQKTANVASFLTHLCVVIAIIPFTLMAGNALS